MTSHHPGPIHGCRLCAEADARLDDADETTWTLAADELRNVLDEIDRETRPGMIDVDTDHAGLRDLFMELQDAQFRLTNLKARVFEAWRAAS